jgi:hypothetical protein
MMSATLGMPNNRSMPSGLARGSVISAQIAGSKISQKVRSTGVLSDSMLTGSGEPEEDGFVGIDLGREPVPTKRQCAASAICSRVYARDRLIWGFSLLRAFAAGQSFADCCLSFADSSSFGAEEAVRHSVACDQRALTPGSVGGAL